MSELLKRISDMIVSVKDDDLKLQQILDYLETEVFDGEFNSNPIDELPEKFRPLVNEIAQYMEMGMICYLNPETAELSFIPQELFYDLDGSDDVEEVKQLLDEIHGWQMVEFLDWEVSIEFEPFPSHESFRVMEKYAHNLPENEKIRPRLIDSLRNRKPFANFGRIIDNSNLREDWFEFKRQYLDNIVAQQLLVELDQLKGKRQ